MHSTVCAAAIVIGLVIAPHAGAASAPLLSSNVASELAARLPGALRLVPAPDGVARLRLVSPARTPKPWDLQAHTGTVAPVARGDTVALTFAIRAAGAGHIVAKLQDGSAAALLREDVAATSDWRVVRFTHVARQDYAPGALMLALFLGLERQTIELQGLSLANHGAVPPAALPPPPPPPAGGEPLSLPAPPVPAAPVVLPPLPPDATNTPRYVMLKLDDLKAGDLKSGVHGRFRRVADGLRAQGLAASFGIIGRSLETTNLAFLAWVRTNAVENGGPFEFWHHGYDHGLGFELDGKRCVAEFAGPDEAYQREHFERAQRLMQEKTGLTFRTFGAPGNGHDAATVRVLAGRPEVAVWLYGNEQQPAGKRVLRRSLNLEHAVGKVDYDAFAAKYQQQRTRDYLVLQGHPGMWADESYAAFQRIVAQLCADGWTFTTPWQFSQLAR